MAGTLPNNQIDAEPTKSFFIDMFTRDIPLDQAILDLVDNSVDGAKALIASQGGTYDQRWIKLEFDKEKFSIIDNCGGFDRKAAREYAFKFGRPGGAVRTPHSIGQFGVGMKRALFKFGRHFVVNSATPTESWQVEVPVDAWEAEPGWTFPMSDLPANAVVSQDASGTQIVVTKLRPEVSSRFNQQNFHNNIIELIKSKHRQFISEGLSIVVNGKHVDATSLLLLVNDGLRPGIDNLHWAESGRDSVTARIIVAVAPSIPRQAGWYVVCNGRVVLEADRTPVTGWGLMEEAKSKLLVPSFHNQFARFRGLVFFDSNDSSQVPWNTTKTSVDQDNPYWRETFDRMIEMMRPVIDFLNELDADIDEHSKQDSPLNQYVTKSTTVSPDGLQNAIAFQAPTRERFVKGPKKITIQYSRPVDDVAILQDVFGVHSARAVGEATFDSALRKQKR